MAEASESLIEKCQKTLAILWREVSEAVHKSSKLNYVNETKLRTAIYSCINSKTKTYRYVLPTQLIAKVADPTLDSRCVQASRGGKGAFDARSICDKVITLFDKENQNVLGGSPEPYVNNPLRVPEITKQHRNQQKDKKSWDELCFILDKVEAEQNLEFTRHVLKQVLLEIYNRLSTVKVVYPIPTRISIEQTQKLIRDFLSVQSGGDRVLAITSSLLETIGLKFKLFSEVCRSKITAADTATGLVADIECRDNNKKSSSVLKLEIRNSPSNR